MTVADTTVNEAAIAPMGEPRARDFAGLLSRDAWLFAAVAVLIPNLPFLFLSIFACPTRTLSISLYVMVAMLALWVPAWIAVALLVLAVGLDVVQVIAGVFDLGPDEIVASIQYAVAFDVFASPVYLVIAAALVTTTIATAILIVRYRQNLRRARALPALLCAFALLAFDVSANALTLKKMGFLYEAQTPFDSAIAQTGLDADAIAASGHNVLLVVVEGMGAFDDPAHQALLAGALQTAGLDDAHTLTTGMSRYVGSTTGAESRELCGAWGNHRDYMDKAHGDCLPARLAAKGYDTAAFHAFTGDFFDRRDWYPNIGFAHAAFMEELTRTDPKMATHHCGLTLTGLCDLDVADKVEAFMTQAGDTPRFGYWLTLNTHMPVPADIGTPRLGCADGGPFGDRTVCMMTEMWIDVLKRVAAIARDPRLKTTDILIVGDHNPPLWTRHGRGLFRPGHVTWFALKAKDGAAPQRHASR